MTPTLRPRTEALAPRAVVGEGVVARALANRLLQCPAEHLRQLRVVVTPELLVALGPEDALPWVDGVRYLGCEAGTPGLLLPTTREATVAAMLLERALRRAHHLPDGPFALLSMELLVPLGRAVIPGRSVLAPLLESAS